MAPGRGGRSLSLSIRNIIIKLHKAGISPVKICKTLQDKHQFKTTRQSVRRFIIRFETTGCVHDKRKPRRPEHTKVRRIHMQFINMWMAQNPEMTAANIQGRLEKQCGIQLSKEYVCMLRRKLNWTPKHMKYGQLISHKNVKHRLDWCLDQLISKDSFRDVIYVDESTVEMCSSGRLFFHRHGSNMDRLPAKAPKPKHSYKVNVWGGISHRGRTSICIFSGIMDSEIYQKILEDNLLPFATANYPDGFRLYQDNDRKHTSKSTRRWMEEKQLTESVMTTPASSPDLNPIENVWSAMKTYLRSVVKPKKKEELVQGIVSFWNTLSAEKCGHYIDHVHRVIPHVVLNAGGPTQF